MNTFQLAAGLGIAVIGPWLTLGYLRRILLQVLEQMCPGPAGSEFWLRTTLILAITGSVWLTLVFGFNDPQAAAADFLRRALLLTTMATFVSVAIIARRIWSQVAKPAITPAKEPHVNKWNETVAS